MSFMVIVFLFIVILIAFIVSLVLWEKFTTWTRARRCPNKKARQRATVYGDVLECATCGWYTQDPKQDTHNKGYLSPAENSSPNAFNLIETATCLSD